MAKKIKHKEQEPPPTADSAAEFTPPTWAIRARATEEGKAYPLSEAEIITEPEPGQIVVQLLEEIDVSSGGFENAKFRTVTPRDTLLAVMLLTIEGNGMAEAEKAELQKVLTILARNLKTLQIEKRDDVLEITDWTTFKKGSEAMTERALSSAPAKTFLTYVSNVQKIEFSPGADGEPGLSQPPKDGVFRFSRTAARVLAQTIGKDTAQGRRKAGEMDGEKRAPRHILKMKIENSGSLFNEETAERTAISKMASVALTEALKYWERLPKSANNSVKLERSHLREIANNMGAPLDHVKRQFLLLGRSTFPFDDPINPGQGSIVLIQPFTVRFNYPESIERQLRLAGKSAGQKLNLIPGHVIESVEITPHEFILRDLLPANKNADRLGYFLATEHFPTFPITKNLSDLATRLFNFTASNPEKVRDATLWRGLGLLKEVKIRGRAKMIERLKNAGKELIEAGHLHTFDQGKDRDFWEWKRTLLVVKDHERKAPKEGDKPKKTRGRPRKKP